jgi:hypothetical protein
MEVSVNTRIAVLLVLLLGFSTQNGDQVRSGSTVFQRVEGGKVVGLRIFAGRVTAIVFGLQREGGRSTGL